MHIINSMAPMLQRSCAPLAFLLAFYLSVGEVAGSPLDMGEWTGGGWYIQNPSTEQVTCNLNFFRV